MAGIIWLASYPKSGNTWLRVFLYNLLRNPGDENAINKMRTFNRGDSQVHLYEEVTDQEISTLSLEELAILRPKMHHMLTNSSQESVFVKTHCSLTKLADVDQITMSATTGAIYIIRNPLDVCISMAPHFGISIDEAINWMADPDLMNGGSGGDVPYLVSAWSRHVSSWTAQNNSRFLHITRYEDMLNKPGKVFKAIAAYMGLKPPANVLRQAIKASSFDVVKKQEEKFGFVERRENAKSFFRAGKANQWKTVLSEDQVKRVIEGNYEMMKEFGYLPLEYR
jgi:hypothetical protein